MPGLGTSFGRGGATTPQWDLQNSQCIVIQGSDMAECHPVAFRFVIKAKQRGAVIIHVDPRFSRTSALADLHVPIRPGTDIAFLGGLINHVLQNKLWFKEYVVHYTNASAIINEGFRDTEDLDGLFSGFDREQGQYDFATWQYADQQDLTLQHPHCVFQILKRHYARYTPEMVERTCGVPQDTFLKVARAIAENSGPERTTAFCYAVGWTQHSKGVQIIRAACILQLLLGNIGRPGGGILALRGHATIQGSTDIPTLYNLLPGYLGQPHLQKQNESLGDYVQSEYAPSGWWANAPKYIVSLLKAWYGERAREDNEYCFSHLPRISGDHSQLPMTQAIHDGQIKGLFLMGQNPAVGGQNARFVRRGLANLEWMVVRDPYENETAAFWYASPEVKRGELDPRHIKTEIFLLPAAITGEKEGSYTNTHRMVQWHDKAVEPPGDARSESWFLYHLGRRLKELYAGEADQGSIRVRQLTDLTWEYPLQGPYAEPDVQAVLQEINGYRVADGRPVKDFEELQDDGSTACGCWIYSGVMPQPKRNLARNRRPDPGDGAGTHLYWGFTWPANRRLLYNRCSADPEGRPWSERKKYVWWDAEQREWVGHDVPDFPRHKPPDYQPDWAQNPKGMDAHSGRAPFVMTADGRARLFVPSGLKDGPLPAHYEPLESPLDNPLYGQQSNPAAQRWERPENVLHAVAGGDYPYVITTYRLTEHQTGGLMSRSVPWLAETQPEGFIELSPELAAEKGIRNGDWATLWTARGEVEARVLVTSRIRPLRHDGRLVHVIGMPWHFGYKGLAQGDVANTLSAMVGDPNVSIHESKVFTCNLRAGRKARA